MSHEKLLEMVREYLESEQEKPLDIKQFSGKIFACPGASFSATLEDSLNIIKVEDGATFCGNVVSEMPQPLQNVIREILAAALAVVLELKNKPLFETRVNATKFLDWWKFLVVGFSEGFFVGYAKKGSPGWTIPFEVAYSLTQEIVFDGVKVEVQEKELKALF